MTRPDGIRTVRAVQHAAALLRALERGPRPQALSELSREIGLTKTSTLHLLRTLELERFVARDDDGRFHLSWGVYELGSAVTRSVDLARNVRAHLDRLAETVGEATLLAIVDERSVLYLDRGQAGRPFTMVAHVGRRSPLHTNASGKLLLAHLPAHERAEILAEPLERRTPATMVDPTELTAALERIRREGYATCWEEQERGLASIAVPLRDYTGEMRAALTIAGPSRRVTRRAVPRLLEHLRAEADAASARMGFATAPSPATGCTSDHTEAHETGTAR